MASKKILVVLPPRDFDENEFFTLKRMAEARGHKISVASIASGAVESSRGVSVLVDVRLHEVKTYEYDAVVFMGGDGARIYFDDPQARKLASDVKYKTLGATGNATVLLSQAGVLSKKKVTAPPEWADWIVRGGATFTGRPLEIDEKLITAQGPAFVETFANAFLKTIES
ncbi:MAG: DJ-1/PfpI family protein [Anaerolineae bacterium]|nr:DJ-1/PfpI family protein [Anaerolineae bacterium]MDW8098861.1 DJ-1/PfpI family protein [Anaerolineae bacterium]